MTLKFKKLFFAILFSSLWIPIVSIHAERILKVKILSAENASFVLEPNSYTYLKKAITKEDLKGNAHVPFSKFSAYLSLFNPLNWKDRYITKDSYDVLLKNVRILGEKNRIISLESLLIRHVTHTPPSWENYGGYSDYPDIKKYIVDLPDSNTIEIDLWYSDEPVLLYDFTEQEADRSIYSRLGHIHLYRTSSDLSGHTRDLYGRYGILFGRKYRDKRQFYETNFCQSEDH